MGDVSTPAKPPSSAVARLVAWTGGAWFAAALAIGAWWFAVVLGRPAEPPPLGTAAAVAWNVALLFVFAAHHSVMARTRAKAWVARLVPPALERSVYVWVASSLFVLVCVAWQRVPGQLYAVDGAARLVLAAVQIAGVVLTIAGARVLDGLDLAGIRQVTRAPRPSSIRVVWPFTLVRHPIYLGWVLMVFAASPMTYDRLVWAVTTTAYLAVAIPWEERSLHAAAGAPYADYCRQVRWRLIPGLY